MDKTLIRQIAMLPFLLCIFSAAVLALVRIINGQRDVAEIFRRNRFQNLLDSLSLAFMFAVFNLSLDDPRLLGWFVASAVAAAGVGQFIKNRPPPRSPGGVERSEAHHVGGRERT